MSKFQPSVPTVTVRLRTYSNLGTYNNTNKIALTGTLPLTCNLNLFPNVTVVLWFCSSSPEMLQQWSSVPQPQKSLSVVTTVWGGMTPTSQTSPYSNSRLPGTYTNKAMYNSSVQSGFNAASPPMQKPPYSSSSMSYNRQTPGTVYNQQKWVLH